MEKIVKTAGVYKKADVIWSDAYQKLTATEHRIYEVFLMKCRYVNKKDSRKMRVPAWSILNNGNITFNYSEANRIGIPQSTFTRSIDNLVKIGFIDIAIPGHQCFSTRYSISERWKKYGTDKFEKKERKKRILYKPGKGTRFIAMPIEESKMRTLKTDSLKLPEMNV